MSNNWDICRNAVLDGLKPHQGPVFCKLDVVISASGESIGRGYGSALNPGFKDMMTMLEKMEGFDELLMNLILDLSIATMGELKDFLADNGIDLREKVSEYGEEVELFSAEVYLGYRREMETSLDGNIQLDHDDILLEIIGEELEEEALDVVLGATHGPMELFTRNLVELISGRPSKTVFADPNTLMN